MKSDYTTNSRYITHTIAFWKVGRIHLLSSVPSATKIVRHSLVDAFGDLPVGKSQLFRRQQMLVGNRRHLRSTTSVSSIMSSTISDNICWDEQRQTPIQKLEAPSSNSVLTLSLSRVTLIYHDLRHHMSSHQAKALYICYISALNSARLLELTHAHAPHT